MKTSGEVSVTSVAVSSLSSTTLFDVSSRTDYKQKRSMIKRRCAADHSTAQGLEPRGQHSRGEVAREMANEVV